MPRVNIHEAKTHFSRLVDAAMAGEEIVIAKAGKPAVRLVPLDAAPAPGIRFGVMKGEIEIAEDFDAPLPDELQRAFEGEA
ncbi:type II toxin-antitoxin system Phd/YefM family antitoxin [Desulfuromonas acetexigens]|uniref:Antitoxin n=1 Tax=Trichloromonas acetexigens TaxID=38815 RepID=A0A550J901_9BACT|nr:type II toxin-antitoxin system Phd/YefM family antitoxin [Desulfuromonas acetexigens]TRO79708.1 type II toxin-antitoxin system Phd/YefM family antitoxin [Desulfuromonas acetexigens]